MIQSMKEKTQEHKQLQFPDYNMCLHNEMYFYHFLFQNDMWPNHYVVIFFLVLMDHGLYVVNK